ncbi:DUF1446 domain-containing protein [Jannaschia sp. W003]|uniref:DUF1446 domain-containing protein n=1 Tax=Jannaschia sp. W003 TaxID=2867012 RepID=UPI0021A499A4|nr:DUF1446 domain-containing protein [Jannaschia sp. W003]UWQ21128.1 DUF1446 domain-containing protein [Jannaschia sp. W003]
MRTRVLVPAGALGLGWDAGALEGGLAAAPDLIAIDGGSTDSGPSYLGRGVSKYSRGRVKADWAELVAARARLGVPLVIGTAGTCGAGSAVDWLAEITREILAETGTRAKVARLYCDRDPAALAEGWADARPLDGAPPVEAADVAACSNVVALAGVEQVGAALDTGADIVIAGRTTDTAILAALPIMRGADPGAAWHGAKIAECGALCTSHPWSGAILLDVDERGFEIAPCLAAARATPESVAAHMLYENSDPIRLHEPGGHLDVSAARYAALDDRRVRVEGGVWVPGPYGVKLEGARRTGFGAAALALVRDPATLRGLDAWCDSLMAEAVRRLGDRAARLSLMRIGVDGTLGASEPTPGAPVEAGVMLKVLAPSQDEAMEAARIVNPLLLHHSVGEGPMPTFSFPFSPPEMALGEQFEFVLHHVWPQEDPMEGFRLEVEDA